MLPFLWGGLAQALLLFFLPRRRGANQSFLPMRMPVPTSRFKHPVHPKAKRSCGRRKTLITSRSVVGGAAKLLGKYPGSQSAFILVALSMTQAPGSPFGHGVFGRACFEWLSALRQIPGRESIFQTGRLRRRGAAGGLDHDSPLGQRTERSGVEVVEINGRKIFRSVPPTVRADLLQITQKAFLDTDAIVRQNVLKYHIYLGVPLPAATLVKLLGDSDLGVLLTALDRITSNAGRPEVVDRIESSGIRIAAYA